jgi:hypothetical protein
VPSTGSSAADYGARRRRPAAGPSRTPFPLESGPLVLPAIAALPPTTNTRRVSLNDEDSQTVKVITDTDGNVVLACDDPDAEPFGPGHALLGTVTDAGEGVVKRWDDPITENPAVGATEGVGDVQHAARPPELPLTLSAAFARLDRRPLFVSAPARTEFQALQFMPALVARSFCYAVCSSAAGLLHAVSWALPSPTRTTPWRGPPARAASEAVWPSTSPPSAAPRSPR